MNKILKNSILVPVLISGFLCGCSNSNVAPSDQVKQIVIPARIAAGTTDFTFDLFKNLQATQPESENLFISPLSLHMALGMLLNGAENETAQQILKAFKMEGVSIDDLNKAYKTLQEELPAADPKVSLGLANSMWYRKGFQVEADFQTVLKQSFDAQITGLEFNDAAKEKINQWASDKTNGKIKKVIEEISQDQVMFLMNALYFKGDWKYQFDAGKTLDAPFTLESGAAKTVKMMYLESGFKASAGDAYNAVQLPYANGQFNLTLLIPQGDHTVGDVISGLTSADWNDLQASRLTEKKVKVGLPRFTLEYSAKLNETLEKMGISKIFSEAAELGKISKSANLMVDFVKQDTYIGIDEKGTEAAAVTSIGIEVTSVGPSQVKYICDRPFVLVLSENTSNTILFIGRIMNPQSK